MSLCHEISVWLRMHEQKVQHKTVHFLVPGIIQAAYHAKITDISEAYRSRPTQTTDK